MRWLRIDAGDETTAELRDARKINDVLHKRLQLELDRGQPVDGGSFARPDRQEGSVAQANAG